MADKVKAVDTTSEDYAKIQLSTLMDNEFMREFFRDNIPAVQFVLRIIMNKDDLIVKTLLYLSQRKTFSREAYPFIRLNVLSLKRVKLSGTERI